MGTFSLGQVGFFEAYMVCFWRKSSAREDICRAGAMMSSLLQHLCKKDRVNWTQRILHLKVCQVSEDRRNLNQSSGKL